VDGAQREDPRAVKNPTSQGDPAFEAR